MKAEATVDTIAAARHRLRSPPGHDLQATRAGGNKRRTDEHTHARARTHTHTNHERADR